MKVHGKARLLGLAVGAGMLVATIGCEEGTTAPALEETALLSVIPQGGATGVDPNGPLVIEFSHPMHQGGQHGYGMGQGGMGGMGGGFSMGEGWMHPTNGSYGMVFIFTTA